MIYKPIVKIAARDLRIYATEKGIRALQFEDSNTDLSERFLKEDSLQNGCREITSSDNPYFGWIQRIRDYLEGKAAALDIPLDIRGTPFQMRVWKAIRNIPYGETRSYSEIAQAISQLNAVRAVARACALNPVALLIPCHRVINKNGELGGYRWGVKRKQELLALERHISRNSFKIIAVAPQTFKPSKSK